MAEYAFNFDKAQVGQIADSSIHRIDSYPTSGVNPLYFGRPVHYNNGLVQAAGSADPVLGISVFSITQLEGFYPPSSAASILTFGRIYVVTGDAVAANTSAYIDVGGNFGSYAFTGNGKLVGTFLSNAGAGELAVLEFNTDAINI
jgi:hypothetical protein